MSTFDIVVLVLLGISLVYSFFKGMVREIFSILAYGGGYFAAARFSEDATGYLIKFIPNQTIARLVGFGLLFIITSIIISFIGKWVRGLMKSAGGLSAFDRLMGGVLGVAKGVFILTIIMIPFEFFPEVSEKVSQGSVTAPYLKQFALVLRQNVIPPDKLKAMSMPSGLSFGGTVVEKKPANAPGTSPQPTEASGNLDVGKLVENLPDDVKKKAMDMLASGAQPRDNISEKDRKEMDDLIRSIQKN
jgi:membrane protein required for colicin V production